MRETVPLLTEFDPAWVATGTAACQARLPAPLRGFHQRILQFFLDTGGAPDTAWLAEHADASGLDPDTACAALADADLVHRDPAGRVAIRLPVLRC